MSTPTALLQRAPEPEIELPMSGEWLSVAETADRLDVHVKTVYRHLRAGTLPCRTLKIGRTWRIQTDDVETLVTRLRDLLAECEAKPNVGVVLAALVEGDG